jgi:hypothetical protein
VQLSATKTTNPMMTIGQKQALGTQMPRREYFGDIR